MTQPGQVPLTSPSLLLRIRNPGDTESWQTFQEIYAPIIRAYCRRRAVQATDTDDIVQEVLSVVAKSIQTFEYSPEKGRFRAWLGTVTANELKSFISSRANRQSPTLSDGSFSQLPNADPDSDWIAIFSEHIFQVACDRVRQDFEPAKWECFETTWVDRISAPEVAERLGIPVHSVYVNKSRVRKRLEEEVSMLADDYQMETMN